MVVRPLNCSWGMHSNWQLIDKKEGKCKQRLSIILNNTRLPCKTWWPINRFGVPLASKCRSPIWIPARLSWSLSRNPCNSIIVQSLGSWGDLMTIWTIISAYTEKKTSNTGSGTAKNRDPDFKNERANFTRYLTTKIGVKISKNVFISWKTAEFTNLSASYFLGETIALVTPYFKNLPLTIWLIFSCFWTFCCFQFQNPQVIFFGKKWLGRYFSTLTHTMWVILCTSWLMLIIFSSFREFFWLKNFWNACHFLVDNKDWQEPSVRRTKCIFIFLNPVYTK